MFAWFINVAKLPQQEWVLCLSDERVAQAVCPEMAPRLKGFFRGWTGSGCFLAELSWAEGTLARQEHWWAHSLHWWWQQEGKGTKFQSSSVTERCLNSLTFCDVNFQTWTWKSIRDWIRTAFFNILIILWHHRPESLSTRQRKRKAKRRLVWKGTSGRLGHGPPEQFSDCFSQEEERPIITDAAPNRPVFPEAWDSVVNKKNCRMSKKNRGTKIVYKRNKSKNKKQVLLKFLSFCGLWFATFLRLQGTRWMLPLGWMDPVWNLREMARILH